MERVFEPKKWGRDPFAGSFESDVIHDSQGGQEDLESAWGSGRDECQYPEREGDVGRHGNRPPTRFHSSAVREEIEGRWNDHAADRRGDRERRLARGCQFARKRLTLDFQSDKEEEDRHEPIVDPLMNGERRPMSTPGKGNRRRQQAVIGVSLPGIGHDERHARAGDQ